MVVPGQMRASGAKIQKTSVLETGQARNRSPGRKGSRDRLQCTLQRGRGRAGGRGGTPPASRVARPGANSVRGKLRPSPVLLLPRPGQGGRQPPGPRRPGPGTAAGAGPGVRASRAPRPPSPAPPAGRNRAHSPASGPPPSAGSAPRRSPQPAPRRLPRPLPGRSRQAEDSSSLWPSQGSERDWKHPAPGCCRSAGAAGPALCEACWGRCCWASACGSVASPQGHPAQPPTQLKPHPRLM